jgi:hypothetical protein
MDIGEPGQSGRHRIEDGAAIWLPMGGDLAQPPLTTPQLRPAPPEPDPFVDTDAMGLRKFNIGLVPASVTPPRTWKRAAWFAVLSSAGVLVGLAIAAAKLVGPNGPVERIGMPGYPTDMPLLTDFGTTTTAPPATSAPGRRLGDAVPNGLIAGAVDHAHTPAAGSPSTVLTPGPSASPHVTIVPVDARPLVDGEAIATSTERFYEQMAANANTTFAIISESFRSNGESLLERRFADVSLIEVTEISVDPARAITVSTLQVTRKDGSTSTEKRELVFTTGGVPLIYDERPADGE